jgi:Putative zinc-finger
MSLAAAAEVCPDAEVLAAYVDDGLSEAEVGRMEAHLATCVSCRALMARLSPIQSGGSVTGPSWRLPRIDARWGALAATLLVGTALWMAWPGGTTTPESTIAGREAPPDAGALETKAASPRAVESAPPPAVPAATAAPAMSEPAQAPATVGAKGRRSVATLADETRQRAARAEADSSLRRMQPAAAAPVPAPPMAVREAEAKEEARLVGADQAPLPPPASSPARPAFRSASAARPDAAGTPAPAPPPSAPVLAERAARNAAPGPPESGDKLLGAAQGQVAAKAPMLQTSTAAADWPSFAEPEGRLRWRIVSGRWIESSSDGGTKWNPTFDSGSVRLLAGAAPSMSAAWVCGARGFVVRRAIPGSWTRVSSPSSEDLVSITASSDASARVTTRSGFVFETTDGGATWQAR